MMPSTTQLEDAVLALPDAERADLAFKLLQSLSRSDAMPDVIDQLDLRVDAYESGQASAADWDDVSARLQEALIDRKAP